MPNLELLKAACTGQIGVIYCAKWQDGASQGSPWELAFGAKLTDADKVRGNLAGLWGVPFLSLAMIALYQLDACEAGVALMASQFH